MQPTKSQGVFKMSSSSELPAEGFIRADTLLRIVPYSKATLWRKVKNGTFPLPLKLSERITAWRVEDIREWIADHNAPRMVS
jgi:prophage regulatory protein